jgi:fluoride exporter
MDTLTRYLAVAIGSALGGMLRYYLGGSMLSRYGGSFPTVTFFINTTGSFIIGFFLTLVLYQLNISLHLRLAIAVGFVGSYTTFSTFEYETMQLIESKNFIMAFSYVGLSVLIGLIATWLGVILARRLVG